MKRVFCINAQPIEGHGNTDLHLLQEGKDYEVRGVHPETGAFDIGVSTNYCIAHNVTCYWGSTRFIECQDDNLKEEEDDNN